MKLRRMICERPQKLSVCMLAQDSAHCIGEALESVREIRDEIIVVDSGSSDDTMKIAESFEKVKVLNNPWPGNYAVQKNHAINQATGDWILILDSDEVVGAGLRRKSGIAKN